MIINREPNPKKRNCISWLLWILYIEEFKKMIYVFYLILLIFSTNCSTAQKENADPDSLFQSCMQTFQDAEKCNQMKQKAQEIANEKELEEKKKKRKVELTPEQEKNLWIRDDLKNALTMKSPLYVKETLGEPDEKRNLSNGNMEFIYRRPIARYSTAHDPDQEIKVYFVKDKVSKVFHIQAETTPNTGWNSRKKL